MDMKCHLANRFLTVFESHCALFAPMLLSFACSFAAFAGGPVVEVSKFDGRTIPEGWVVSDSVYCSPTYSNSVIGIDMSYTALTSGQSGQARVFAVDKETQVETQIALLNTSSVGASLRFPDDSDNRSFRIEASGLALNAFSATWFDRFLDVPTNVAATALTTDSIEVSWAPVDGASSYRVCVWTNNIVGASDGVDVWSDDFSSAAAGATSAKAISSEKFNDSYADAQGWECNQYIYPSTVAGAIRIGGADKTKGGTLLSPQLAAGDWHLRIRAWRYKSEDGTDMPIMRVSGGTTSLVSVVTITTAPGTPDDVMVKLPRIADGDRLLLGSFTNKLPRVILDRISLVSGYSEGESVSEVISETVVSDGTSCTISGLPPSMLVNLGVTAVGDYKSSSAMSESVLVDLANPPPRAMLNAVPISSLEAWRYLQDFDSMSELDSGSAWYNGVTLPYWQSFKDGQAIDRIYASEGTSTSGRMYILSSAKTYADGGCAFGSLAPSGSSFVWGVAFTNDTANAVELTGVSFNVGQWGFNNTVTQAINFAYLVTNELVHVICESDRWVTNNAWRFETPFADGVKRDPPQVGDIAMPISVECNGVTIKPGEVVILRWDFTRPKNQTGASAILGIDDVDVGFSRRRSNFVISIVKTGNPLLSWPRYVQ